MRASSSAEALRYFLSGEIAKPNIDAERRRFFEELLAETDGSTFTEEVKRRWPSDDDCSVVGWTVGTQRFDRSRQVGQWTETEIAVGEAYSKSVGGDVNAYLDLTSGNIKQFAKMMPMDPEWLERNGIQPDRLPGEDFHIIAVRHCDEGHNGTVELLDGFHRLVPMAVHDLPTVKAFLATF